MRSMKSLRFVMLLLLLACEPVEDCQLDPNSSEFYLAFSNSPNGSVTFDSIKNNLFENVFFDADSSFSSIQLPLTTESNTLTYTFFTDSVDFSLSINYQSRFNLYGPDCPPSIFYSDLSVVSTNFDTAIVVNAEVDRRITENIEVFF